MSERRGLLREIRSKVYWTAMGVRHRVQGTRAFRNSWRTRPSGVQAASEVEMSHPHRDWLVAQFANIGSFESLLDVGCGSAFDIERLATRFAGARYVGMDINEDGLALARQRLARDGMANVELLAGRSDDLFKFRDKEFDIAMTNAVLLYTGPDLIEKTFKGLFRVASRKLVLIEFHDPAMTGNTGWKGRFTRDGWVRNYEALVREFCPPGTRIEKSKVPADVRPAGRWPQFGWLISVSAGDQR